MIPNFINFFIAGMIDAGLGETQVNSFYTAQDVPHIHTGLLKKYERTVGREIEVLAKESMEESLLLEINAATEANDIITDK